MRTKLTLKANRKINEINKTIKYNNKKHINKNTLKNIKYNKRKIKEKNSNEIK